MTTTRHRQFRTSSLVGVSALLLAFACAPSEDAQVASGAGSEGGVGTEGDSASVQETTKPAPTKKVAMSAEEAMIAKKKAAAAAAALKNAGGGGATTGEAGPAKDLPGREVRGVAKASGIKGGTLTPPAPRRVPTGKPTPIQGNASLKPAPAGQPAGDGHDHANTAAPGQAAKNQYTAQMNPNAKLEIEFGTESHDFGRARQGDILEHTFAMASVGTEDLVIRQASPTCGCTLGKVEIMGGEGEFQEYVLGDPIPPGADVRLTARMDTTNKSHKTNVRINVYTNDPIGLTQLGLTANVEPFISATPSFVNFGDLKLDSVQTQIVDVRTGQGEKVALTIDDSRQLVKPAGMDVKLEAVSPDEDGKSSHWRATITVGPGLEEGQLGYSLQMLTERDMPMSEDQMELLRKKDPNAETPKYRVSANVTGRVLGVLSFTPSFLSMGLVQPGLRVPRTMTLTSHDPSFSLDGVSVELRGEQGAELAWKEHFSTEIKPVEGKTAVEITLTLEGLPEGSDGSFRGEMVVKTGHPSKPEVPVRFSGVCRSPIKK